MNNRRFGAVGERVAQKYMINKGYKIITTNFYTKKGEIDIIAVKDKIIVFVEVKTRSNNKFGTPAMAVNYKKKQHIKIAAKIYLLIHKLYQHNVRFDVIEVVVNRNGYKINHIKGIM